AAPGAGQAEVLARLTQYAHDVRVGRLTAEAFPDNWGVRPAPYDPGPELAAALATDKLEPWLQSLPPPYAGYRGLRRALARYRKIAADGGWRAIPDGPAFGLGERGERVVALRARLKVEDSTTPDAGGATFD